jgi:hypothetical protein
VVSGVLELEPDDVLAAPVLDEDETTAPRLEDELVSAVVAVLVCEAITTARAMNIATASAATERRIVRLRRRRAAIRWATAGLEVMSPRSLGLGNVQSIGVACQADVRPE